ncbi:MAG TPA: hypothetical protein VMZ71_02370, partial [Gemmataceae bacterium]|nr:hypothetical protein [Gemmataceae bacterium]
NYEGVEREGETKVFEDKLWTAQGVKGERNQSRSVTCRLVRNVSGVTLYAKTLVVLDPTNPNRVTGRATTLFQLDTYPVDEFLPATGVPTGDLFWIVVGGPAKVLTPMTGAEFNATSIAAGDLIGAATTNGGSTAAGSTVPAGRAAGPLLVNVALTTNTQYAQLIRDIRGGIGMAMSAMTSGQTNADMLIDVGWKRGGGYP